MSAGWHACFCIIWIAMDVVFWFALPLLGAFFLAFVALRIALAVADVKGWLDD
jgi:hypothetical protein